MDQNSIKSRGLISNFDDSGDFSPAAGGSNYAVAYEDKDGDWMLVGDVPWR